jgi:argininosuccinate lyase
MPQKKNPDVPELARGKTGRVYGDLIALLTLMKSQPLAYNKDNQEDKEPLFDAVDTVQDTLRIFADMIPHIEVQKVVMQAAAEEGFATATDLADYLVKKGLAFRDAHEAVAHAVKACVGRKCTLTDLSLSELRLACGLDTRADLISEDVFPLLTVTGSVQSRQHPGGTAPEQVLSAVQRGRAELKL